MIIVRPYAEDDKSALAAMHKAQGFEYEAPDWDKMLVSGVIEVDGEVQMAAFLRKTSETYLLLDPKAAIRKRERLAQLLIMHRELVAPAHRVGFEDTHCWLPPEIDKEFGKLIMHLGWEKPLWTCYSMKVRKT